MIITLILNWKPLRLAIYLQKSLSIKHCSEICTWTFCDGNIMEIWLSWTGPSSPLYILWHHLWHVILLSAECNYWCPWLYIILDFITSLRCYECSCLAIAHTAYKFKNILLMLFFFHSKIMTTYISLADFVICLL